MADSTLSEPNCHALQLPDRQPQHVPVHITTNYAKGSCRIYMIARSSYSRKAAMRGFESVMRMLVDASQKLRVTAAGCDREI